LFLQHELRITDTEDEEMDVDNAEPITHPNDPQPDEDSTPINDVNFKEHMSLHLNPSNQLSRKTRLISLLQLIREMNTLLHGECASQLVHQSTARDSSNGNMATIFLQISKFIQHISRNPISQHSSSTGTLELSVSHLLC
jgi:hypothetical protein